MVEVNYAKFAVGVTAAILLALPTVADGGGLDSYFAQVSQTKPRYALEQEQPAATPVAPAPTQPVATPVEPAPTPLASQEQFASPNNPFVAESEGPILDEKVEPAGLFQEHGLMDDLLRPDKTPENFQPNKFLGMGFSGHPQNPAGFTYKWAPDKWAHIGGSIKASFNSHTTYNSVRNPYRGASGNFFRLNNARLLTSGQLTKYIGYELNFDMSGVGNRVTRQELTQPDRVLLLDAIVKANMYDWARFWMGQFLPPSSRSNIAGPFHINGFKFPFVWAYPNIIQGRQLGAMYWGELGGGQVSWSVGVFDGRGATLRPPFSLANGNYPPNVDNNTMVDARVVVDFLDPEPGYYDRGSYYGKKDIFAISYGIQTMHDFGGTNANAASLTVMSWNVLYDVKMANGGVVTLEGSFFLYNEQNLASSWREGSSGLLYAAYMFPQVLSIGPIRGRLRPYVRYQRYNHDHLAAARGMFKQGVDIGTEYVMNGDYAQVLVAWQNRDPIGGPRMNGFMIGAQTKFY